MPIEPDALVRLAALAPLLDDDLGYELRRLIDADSDARQLSTARAEASRATGVANECRRQLATRDAQLDRAHQAIAALVTGAGETRVIAGALGMPEVVMTITPAARHRLPRVRVDESTGGRLHLYVSH